MLWPFLLLSVSQAVDTWALGVLVYDLIVGMLPFKAHTPEGTANAILNGELTFPRRTTQPAKHFITSCLQRDPAARPTMLELQQSAWLQQNADQTS